MKTLSWILFFFFLNKRWMCIGTRRLHCAWLHHFLSLKYTRAFLPPDLYSHGFSLSLCPKKFEYFFLLLEKHVFICCCVQKLQHKSPHFKHSLHVQNSDTSCKNAGKLPIWETWRRIREDGKLWNFPVFRPYLCMSEYLFHFKAKYY